MVEPFSNPNFTSRKLHWDEEYDGSGHNHYEWVSTCDYFLNVRGFTEVILWIPTNIISTDYCE